MIKQAIIAMPCMALVMMTSCGSSKQMQGDNPASQSSTETRATIASGQDAADDWVLTDAQRDMVAGNNAFALRLFRELSGFDSKVISPLSVSYLMGMLANGANGQTREEILGTLECKGVSLDELNQLFHKLLSHAGKADPSTTVRIANYIALNKDFRLRESFVQEMEANYQAGIEALDFSKPATVNHINNWCKRQTGGMIPGIIDELGPDVVSCVMNAIYFNGTWTDKFRESNTKEEQFYGYTRDIKRVPMMRRSGKYEYTDNEVYAAVVLPYGNRSYTMTVLLPHPGKSIDDMMATIEARNLAELPRQMEECVVDLKLPRFTTEVNQDLIAVIAKLGAPTMFGGSADFSRFADGRLEVSKMLQKAKIEVSEEGTKAAAVSAAAVMLTSLNPEQPRHVEFHANRPFVYLITDTASGAIAFMGQYMGD